MPSYRDLILGEAGLLGYWPLDDRSNVVVQDLAPRHLTGAAAVTGAVTAGRASLLANDPAPSMFFTSPSQYIDTANPTGLLATWTLEAWCRPVGNQAANSAVATDKLVTNYVNYTLSFQTGNLAMETGYYNGTWQITPTFNLTDGAIHHCVGTFDGTTLLLYVNGAQVALGVPGSAPTSDAAGFRIGHRWDQTETFNGGIAHVAIYNRALTAVQVLRHYNARLLVPKRRRSSLPGPFLDTRGDPGQVVYASSSN